MSIKEDILYLVKKILILAVFFILIFSFVFGVTKQKDISMNPAFMEGDIIIYYRLTRGLNINDTVVIEYEGKHQVRRIVAREGDTVDINEEGLWINGSLQNEENIIDSTLAIEGGKEFPLTVPKGCYFVLGDARESSIDSRLYGSVKSDQIKGLVFSLIRTRNF